MPKQKAPKLAPACDIGRLAGFIGYWVRKAQVAVYEDFLAGAPVAGLTPGQLAILVLIDKNPNLSQKRLAAWLRVDKSTLAIALHRLSDRGLTQRIRSTEDRRENGLRLTARGDRVLKAMLEYVPRHERRLTKRLSTAERQTLIRLLQKIG